MTLEELISQDFELTGSGNWLHAIDHSSLVLDVKKQIFFWNSKGISGDSYIWLTKVRGLTGQQAKELLRTNSPETAFTFISTIKNQKEEIAYPKLVDIFYEEGVSADRAYWYKRGLSDTLISRYKLGFHDGWYTIPVYMDGLFKNFQMRRDEPKKMITSYYRDNFLLFNSDILRIVDDVVITEGITDSLSLIQRGIMAVSGTAGAGGWSSDWFKYFIGVKSILINYDNDEAGRRGAAKVARELGETRCRIYNFAGQTAKYDIGDYFNEGHTAEEYRDLVLSESRFLYELPCERKTYGRQ